MCVFANSQEIIYDLRTQLNGKDRSISVHKKDNVHLSNIRYLLEEKLSDAHMVIQS